MLFDNIYLNTGFAVLPIDINLPEINYHIDNSIGKNILLDRGDSDLIAYAFGPNLPPRPQ